MERIINIINELLGAIKATAKGALYKNAEGENVEIEDSKDVTKRKKELRTAINVNCRYGINEVNKELDLNVSNRKAVIMEARAAKGFISGISLRVGNFVEGVTGSSKYKDIAFHYTYFYLSTVILDLFERSDLTYDAVDEEGPKAKTSVKATPKAKSNKQ